MTFQLPATVKAETAHLSGEFNGWNINSHPMKRNKDGSFALTLSLEAGQQYRFRYVLDRNRWENDSAADGYVPNPFGSDDSLVKT